MKHRLISFAFGATLSFGVLSTSYAYQYPIVLHDMLAQDGKQTVVSNQGGGLSVRVGNSAWQGAKGCMDGLQPGDPVRINNVKYIPENKQFVAVGYKYGQNKATIYGENGLFCYSADGINWSGHMLFLNSEKDRYRNVSFNDIVYANGAYVVVGQRDNLAVARQFNTNTMNDPDKWVDIWGDYSQPGAVLNSIAIAPDNRLIVAGDNASIYTFSPAGKNNGYKTAASVEQLGGGGANFNQVIYVDDSRFKGLKQFVAIANSATVWYSTDGVRWTQVPDKLGSANFNQIIYANHRFVIAADDGEIWYSGNGTQWKEADGVDNPVNLNRITYDANGYFEASGIDDGGKELTWYSMNGQNWNTSAFPFLYVRNDGYFKLGQICTKHGQDAKKCSYLDYRFGYTVAIGDTLQPLGGLKKGDTLCVNANTGAVNKTNFYFKLGKDAASFQNATIIKVEGRITDPAAFPGTDVTLTSMEYSSSDVCHSL